MNLSFPGPGVEWYARTLVKSPNSAWRVDCRNKYTQASRSTWTFESTFLGEEDVQGQL
jgi:hypothetical protein